MEKIAKLTHKNYLEIYKSSTPTIKDCLAGKSIALLKKEHGQKEITMFLRLAIAQLIQYFNIGSRMNADQIKDTVDLILSEYYHLSIEALKLCFTRAKTGKYGKVLGTDGSIIFEWLNQISNDLSEAVSLKKQLRMPDTDPIVRKEFYDKFKRGIAKDKKGMQANKLKQISEEYKKDPKAYMQKIKETK